MKTIEQTKSIQVAADSNNWPRDEKVLISQCAIIVIDMQNDYCNPGYYMDKAGFDIQRLRKPIKHIQDVLSIARKNNVRVMYTRQASTSEPNSDSANSFPKTGRHGELGWQIIPELSPNQNDQIIEKTTCSAFVSGELNGFLKNHGITNLIFCGNTIDVCVHSTLRSAVDLGYQCLTLIDCCGAVNDNLYAWSIESIKIENGVFGSVASSVDFIRAF